MHIPNFAEVPLGKTVVYHIGYLPADRMSSSILNQIAEQVLELSTSVIFDNPTNRQYCKPRTGTGEFELKQRRIAELKYEYMATRIKQRSV